MATGSGQAVPCNLSPVPCPLAVRDDDAADQPAGVPEERGDGAAGDGDSAGVHGALAPGRDARRRAQEDADLHLPARRGRRAEHGGAVRRRGLLPRPPLHRRRAAGRGRRRRAGAGRLLRAPSRAPPAARAVRAAGDGHRARHRLAAPHALALRGAGHHGARLPRGPRARRVAQPPAGRDRVCRLWRPHPGRPGRARRRPRRRAPCRGDGRRDAARSARRPPGPRHRRPGALRRGGRARRLALRDLRADVPHRGRRRRLRRGGRGAGGRRPPAPRRPRALPARRRRPLPGGRVRALAAADRAAGEGRRGGGDRLRGPGRMGHARGAGRRAGAARAPPGRDGRGDPRPCTTTWAGGWTTW